MDASEFVKAQLPPAPARVLDVGCGDGRLSRELSDLGYRVIGIDPRAPQGAIFRRVSLEEFEDAERFDAAVASGTLHHIADLGSALAKLPTDDRLALFLHFYLDLPFEEVGAVLGLSAAGAKTRVYRAAKKLRPDLEMS
jgi:DNA-directed RNA polymerase specialized sigma24 family protein